MCVCVCVCAYCINYFDKMCLLFDQTRLNERLLPKHTHTHTHTHTHIYIYI